MSARHSDQDLRVCVLQRQKKKDTLSLVAHLAPLRMGLEPITPTRGITARKITVTVIGDEHLGGVPGQRRLRRVGDEGNAAQEALTDLIRCVVVQGNGNGYRSVVRGEGDHLTYADVVTYRRHKNPRVNQ